MSAGINSIRTSAKATRTNGSVVSGECEWRLPSGEDLIAFALAAGFATGALTEPMVGAGGPDRRAPREDRWRRS